MDLGGNKQAKRKNDIFERKNDDMAAIWDFYKSSNTRNECL